MYMHLTTEHQYTCVKDCLETQEEIYKFTIIIKEFNVSLSVIDK